MTTLPKLDLGTISSFAVLSDVHLRDPHDATTALFIKTISELKNVDSIFLIGDIFDFIFAGDAFFIKHCDTVFSAFKRFQQLGGKVYFLEGNHDFGFAHFEMPGLRDAFAYQGDAELHFRHPSLGKVSLRHGDDIVCPENYLHFRRLVKGKFLQKTLSIIPGKMMNLIFTRYANISRKKDKYRALSASFFTQCLQKHLEKIKAKKPDMLILGHVHVYIDAVIDETRIITGPDWFVAPNIFICIGDQVPVRKFLSSQQKEIFSLESPS